MSKRMHKTLYYGIIILITQILPLCFFSTSYSMNVTLTWDANTESNLKGYYLYYKTHASSSYEKMIDVGDVTHYTIKGLSNKNIYFFVVTAHNTSDLESSYSNEVNTVTLLLNGRETLFLEHNNTITTIQYSPSIGKWFACYEFFGHPAGPN
ncbi:MAG: fibronectin type III domain-containing protein [bacterium]